jgi:hypothetical protein
MKKNNLKNGKIMGIQIGVKNKKNLASRFFWLEIH